MCGPERDVYNLLISKAVPAVHEQVARKNGAAVTDFALVIHRQVHLQATTTAVPQPQQTEACGPLTGEELVLIGSL